MRKIVISGINIDSGGALTIFKECLEYCNRNLSDNYEIIALVHKKDIFISETENNIKFFEFPKSKKSWLIRCWYEYFYFKFFSKNIKPYLWLSIHDITPNVKTERLVVYCHNPSPFYNMKLEDIKYDKKLFLFSKFYKYLYKINIKKNNFVIVQQNWIAEKFKQMYSIENVLVYPPNIHSKLASKVEGNIFEKNTFFYPAYPRVFKNFEIICEAAKYLEKQGIDNFKIYLTIDGSENLYSKKIIEKYKSLKTIEFIGLLSREKVYEYYFKVECLIFPSKLETWGLPITEFKKFNKPMIVADLEYAHETVGNYDKVLFFNVLSKNELAEQILNIIYKKNIYSLKSNSLTIKEKKKNNWERLFKKVLE